MWQDVEPVVAAAESNWGPAEVTALVAIVSGSVVALVGTGVQWLVGGRAIRAESRLRHEERAFAALLAETDDLGRLEAWIAELWEAGNDAGREHFISGCGSDYQRFFNLHVGMNGILSRLVDQSIWELADEAHGRALDLNGTLIKAPAGSPAAMTALSIARLDSELDKLSQALEAVSDAVRSRRAEIHGLLVKGLPD